MFKRVQAISENMADKVRGFRLGNSLKTLAFAASIGAVSLSTASVATVSSDADNAVRAAMGNEAIAKEIYKNLHRGGITDMGKHILASSLSNLVNDNKGKINSDNIEDMYISYYSNAYSENLAREYSKSKINNAEVLANTVLLNTLELFKDTNPELALNMIDKVGVDRLKDSFKKEINSPYHLLNGYMKNNDEEVKKFNEKIKEAFNFSNFAETTPSAEANEKVRNYVELVISNIESMNSSPKTAKLSQDEKKTNKDIENIYDPNGSIINNQNSR